MITLTVWTVTTIGVAILIAAIIIKSTRTQHYFFTTNSLFITNTAIASIQILLLVSFAIYYIERVVRATLSKKHWSHRRFRAVQTSAIEITLQLINSICFLLPNAQAIAPDCFFLFSHTVIWTAFVRWTCWNTFFLLFVIQAANLLPSQHPLVMKNLRSSQRPDSIVLDGPWILHYKRIIVWCIMESFLIALSVILANNNSNNNYVSPHSGATPADISTPPAAAAACGEVEYDCSLSPAALVLEALITASACIYVVYYFYLVRKVFLSLYKLPYNQYKMGNAIIRLQVRLRGLSYAFFLVTIITYNYVNFNTCQSFMYSWLGLTPMQIVMTAVVIAQGFLSVPKRPGRAILQVWLQEFAWKEVDIDFIRRQRTSSLPTGSWEGFCMDCEPLFCMEYAIKLLYWSFLAYEQEEVPQSPFKSKKAIELFSLSNFDVVWEPKLNTKAIVGWSKDKVVIAFRGTTSMSNLMSDVQIWRVRHPTGEGKLLLGTAPMVHRGFHRAYTAYKFNSRVLRCVESILNRCMNEQKQELVEQGGYSQKPVDVFVTGHSLGGALAMLCAYEVATSGPCAAYDLDIKCYTYGAPRVGNHAWAKLYNAQVPDTWQVRTSFFVFVIL